MKFSPEHAKVLRAVAAKIESTETHRNGTQRMLREAADLLDPPNPDHHAVMKAFQGQLMICLIHRLGGNIRLPVEEVAVPGEVNLTMAVRDRHLELTLVPKKLPAWPLPTSDKP